MPWQDQVLEGSLTIFGVGRRLAAVVARRAAGTAVILSIGACASVEGPPANMESLSADPIARANLQTKYIEGLRLSADLPQHPTFQPAPPDEWKLIQRAGIDQIDEACNNYLYTLYRFNAQQKAARQGLLAATATTGVIMGLAGATTMAIGITAAALGLSASLFEASTNSVLFSVEASAVRNVVQESRSRYIIALAANPPTTRPDTMIALRGYLSLCTPAVIEANINNSANGSRNSVTTPDKDAGVAAAAMAAPAMTLASREARARTQAAGPVRIEPAPPPPAVIVPDVRLDGEPVQGITPSIVRRVQAALGQKTTGLLGEKDSDTRRAIFEFQAGMQAANEPGWGEPTGKLAGRTADTLTALGRMPAGVLSPFERAFLTNATQTPNGEPAHTVLDPARVREAWNALNMPGTPPTSAKEMLEKMRPAILEVREKTQGVEKGKNYLDAQFWKAIRIT